MFIKLPYRIHLHFHVSGSRFPRSFLGFSLIESFQNKRSFVHPACILSSLEMRKSETLKFSKNTLDLPPQAVTVTVTTSITFLVGNPYKPSFATGVDPINTPKKTYKNLTRFFKLSIFDIHDTGSRPSATTNPWKMNANKSLFIPNFRLLVLFFLVVLCL